MIATNTIVYLDNNSTTAIAPECMAAVAASLQDNFGNPSSKHRLGEAAKLKVLAARAQVAALVGATSPEIVFTSSGTEAIHHAILGALALCPDKSHIITSVVEHPSQLALLQHLEGQGKRITYLPVNTCGQLNFDDLSNAITSDTALISLMWANNETGALFPIAKAAQIAAEKGVLFHTDAVQAVGKVAIDLSQVPVDFLSLSGHKLHATKGIGALFVRKGRKLPPVLFGHQERGRRGGTENVPGIIALGVAAELAMTELKLQSEARVAALRDSLEQKILALFPWSSVNGAASERLAGTSSICFGGIDADLLITKLDKAEICVSAGAACTSTGTEPSHVLLAMGLSPEQAAATIRFSLSRYTKMEEIDRVIEVLPELIDNLLAEAA
ncbi:cysteine desulfurase NifS [Methyloglobulus morosus KoM1]|uniref:cysteine desulfurase n=1 Tax=Methyloglobulus morosus KoM1 TaxID=1116472 RepID=V5C9L9_9GAMM|nr:aminotransferase class V-fold PLP-dependent enzyme [Methyloglobulus morosus]ESS73503.1 cysteine desulfurase NifS [Methyloglobulus morosus KoM1]